ncbi:MULTISPECIES: AAA family ATPase [unclassified Microbacterium]|uniref:AAA family ATPase n=1 Tax=unclassified Microbacterium TaxID=2609290 RepID=UPI000EAA2704|nr:MULTISPECIES: SMC family ATPase [unclassified Microbacterium]MBT2484875.1 SMC family ATPase [Microbacterium sp. ISL-108]RKN67744.1 SMC family ATPase [Microbacterium sp. CGR2]
MRLHRLEVEGFGPFRSRQSVDFDAFADDGIFLIGGRTGAGKSSILDAVCFGLYGGVPRYEGGEKRLRSDHCEPDDPSEVVVDFSTPSGRFRVTRSPEYLRPAKRGGGMTKQAAGVSLDEWTDAGWVGRAARAVDVANELDEILQLSREQFLQVILLAQNRFSEFLLAGSKDRQALLRRLFGTQRFEDVQARFDDRRRAAEQTLGARLATVAARVEEAERLVVTADLLRDGEEASELSTEASAAPPSIPERLEQLRRARARADYRAERSAAQRTQAEKDSAAADAALTSAREERQAQAERDRARVALERLEVEEPRIADARAELAAARAAEALRSTIAATARTRVALDEATESEQSARQTWALLELDAGDDLESWTAERTKEAGGWEHALELERRAEELDAQVRAAREAVDEAAARVAAGESERAALPAEITVLTADRDEARRAADRAADLLTAREAAEARLRAAGETDRLRTAYTAAEQELAAASATHAAAQTELAQLRQRRFEGMAGELAADLADHQPCPVCGSPEHPQPATHSDPVSADDVAEAESARDAAAANERDAAARSSALRAELAAAETRADGRSIEQAETEHAAAGDEYLRSLAAADRQTELDARLGELTARTERLDQERTEDAAALAAARESHVVLVQRQADAQAQIAEARGPFETVAERLAATEIHVATARALLDAVAERERRTQAADEAERDQAAQLARSSFEDVASVERALRPASVQESLDAQISRHAVQREKERAILFDLELRTLPEEPIDLAPAEDASAAARAAWVRTVDEASEASGIAARLRGLIESAAAEHARTAEDAAEFEVLQNLADTIAGRGANTRKMTLETFVLAAELEEIVEAANRRLLDMSTGRYQLQHSDALAARGAASGLGIVVFDAFTGQTRPPQSLSGGETFLTSLALALGLAEVVTARAGGIRLDTLFIDEGFGSLDGDTLDVAMRTLDELRQGGRTVGVISHVEAMQEQIPAQLRVRALPNGPSVIETR